jgi:hypothetical protein
MRSGGVCVRLIDADAIPESATTISTDGRLFVAWSEIIKSPTIDAVPVVRCKDCKHRIYIDTMACCELFQTATSSHDFCSFGVNKT